MTTNAPNAPVAVVEGPKGTAEIYEIFNPGQPLVYQVKFGGKMIDYKSLGEAYVDAGTMTGTKT
jgi:hypothetical protein